MSPECSTNGDPLLATLVPLSGICSKVSVTLGIWLVFVFVWTEVDTQISTYAPTYVTVQGLGAQLCVALFWGHPLRPTGSWLLAPGERGLLQELYREKENILTLFWQRRVLLRR